MAKYQGYAKGNEQLRAAFTEEEKILTSASAESQVFEEALAATLSLF